MADQQHWVVIDTSTNHLMQSFVRGDGYVYLAWPKNSTLRDLEWIREACKLQLDAFINHARRETEKEEAARLEVESWDCRAARGVPGTSKDQPKGPNHG